MRKQAGPKRVELLGEEVGIVWADGVEDYYPMERLRAWSPSAENVGEPDIFGRVRGGDSRTEYPGVRVIGHEVVGDYAIRFEFSDGHRTGLYSYGYLRKIGEALRGEDEEV